MKRHLDWFKGYIGLLLVLGLLLVACQTPTTDTPLPLPPTPQPSSGAPKANVENIEILMMESFPVQISVIAKGNLPDGCTTIDKINTTFDEDSNTFRVEITTQRPSDTMCTEALVPFEENIPLDVHGLAKGTYTVEVNGVSDTFTLSQDNILSEENMPPVKNNSISEETTQMDHAICGTQDSEGNCLPADE